MAYAGFCQASGVSNNVEVRIDAGASAIRLVA